MELGYIISGAAPILRKYQTAATVSRTGIPHLVPAAGGAGVAQATTTAAAGMIGCNVDTATFVTAQQTDGTKAERLITVISNPDAVWKAKLSGGAGNDVALALQTETTGDATGLVVTTGATWAAPTFDEGVVWGFSGANAGQVRKITSVSATAGTVTVAFENDIAINDVFLRAPFFTLQGATAQLTTLLDQVDATIAVGTGAGFRCVELILNDTSFEGRTNSFILMMPTDHVLAA